MSAPLESLNGVEGTGGVTDNESRSPGPVAEWTLEDLDSAVPLNLLAVPVSSGASALIDALTARVAAREGRGNQRRGTGIAKLRGAVGAVIGGLLDAWNSTPPRATFRSLKTNAFSGSPVGCRQFQAVVTGMADLEFISTVQGIRFGVAEWEPGDWSFGGKAARFRPTAALLALAADHGITPASLRADFEARFPTKPPRVPELIVVKPLRARRKDAATRPPPVRPGASVFNIVRHDVADTNAFAAMHTVTGCAPPRSSWVFHHHPALFGRWIAAGEGNYQAIRRDQRRRITIDGGPVAEIDARASHLTIMCGLTGVPLPDGDPYALPGVGSREVGKTWATVTSRQWHGATRKLAHG